jgi:hypothetical protein
MKKSIHTHIFTASTPCCVLISYLGGKKGFTFEEKVRDVHTYVERAL